MTANETLRAMLDERGVKWEDGGEGLTIIPVQDGVPRAWTVNTWPSSKDMGDCLWVQNRHPLTPEQAIATTLGRYPNSEENKKLEAENANLRELATYALRHIIEFECEEPDLKRFRGKPCEDCADSGSSDCPKCMPRMFDVSEIEVDA